MQKILIAKGNKPLHLEPSMTNRHGLITGATGSGKTVTLQVIAENLSRAGIPVFITDVKGDVSGISKAGMTTPKLIEHAKALGLPKVFFQKCPVRFWDIWGKDGHTVRTTIQRLGPLLLSRVFDLTPVQSGTLNQIFKIAQDREWPIIDARDLKAVIQYAMDNAKTLEIEYGRLATTSLGAVQRALVNLEMGDAKSIFGEPSLLFSDFMYRDGRGHGIVNILAADTLMKYPRIYAAMLLWILTDIYEKMPEVGDVDKPRLVLFFDEAHLLFRDMPAVVRERIEQVIRLIRSKGVGVFFITQSPADIPETILSQLGNRVQHALRAYTPKDQRAVKVAAQTLRPNPKFSAEKVITNLGVGEALVSFLDKKGTPEVVERALIMPPQSQIGPITDEYRQAILANSNLAETYNNVIDIITASDIISEIRQEAQYNANNAHSKNTTQKHNRDTLVDAVFKHLGRSLSKKLKLV